MATVQHSYQYVATSGFSDAAQAHLHLATSGQPGQHPHFFDGRLLAPRLAAELLSAVHLIVGSRFFTPANTLARILALADPVVTCGGGWLRFEGFSGCCSAYIRVDMLPGAYEGECVGKGCTNVDFNAPMRAALARVRDGNGLALSVGQDALQLRAGPDHVIEKKVELPLRWIRGLLEVQSYQAGMQQQFQVNGMVAMRFFRALPKSGNNKHAIWVMATAQGLATSALPQANGVRLLDTSRLRILEPLLAKARTLTVYADAQQQANAWVLDFGSMRLTLVLSAEVWRGFSGEGQALRALMQSGQHPWLARLRAHLHWQAGLDVAQLAREWQTSGALLEDGLRVLGASGQVGFDLMQGQYFHRVLPFDLSLVQQMHPRLLAAHALLQADALALVRAQPLEVQVQSGNGAHRVREVAGQLQCSCPWFAKYQGLRGPCKHVLAVEASTIREVQDHGKN